jgi:hypothetical protein
LLLRPQWCAMFDIEMVRVGRDSAWSEPSETSTTLKLPSLTNIPCHRDATSARFWQLVNKASSHYVPPVSLHQLHVGSIGAQDQSYLITGGSDSRIRFWDFRLHQSATLSWTSQSQPRPSLKESTSGPRRLMLCHQPQSIRDSHNLPQWLFHG